MNLFVFDRELTLLGILDDFTSLQWIRGYAICGKFELHCSLTPYTLELLQTGNVLWKNDGQEAGYIDSRIMDQDANGNEFLVVKGNFLMGYLGRRIIWGEEILQSTVEAAMRTLVNKHAIIPTDPNRVIPNLVLGTLHGYPLTINYQTSYKPLGEGVESLCGISGLGYRILFDVTNQSLIFDVYQGLDRTVGQSINPRCIFSREFENILTQQYTDSLNNFRNTALVGGMGEGTSRIMASIGSSTGLDRFELFVDAKSLTKTVNGVTISDSDYLGTLVSQGNSKLASTVEVQTFDSTLNLDSNLEYKVDFDLGDIITCVSKRWGITLDSRITEIQEIYEESGLKVNITLGNHIPTLLDKIKQRMG